LKILLDFNFKLGKETNFKPKIADESLNEINNDNGIVNLATLQNISQEYSVLT
jgi:hypothetical protein